MALTRPLKEGSVTTYQAKVGLGFKDILASEADGDHDTMYAAWNGALGGDLSGNLPNPTVVAAAKSKWTVSGATLTPTDATKTVSVPGGAAAAGTAYIILGSNTAKARLQSSNTTTPAWLALTTNRDNVASTQDDATKPSWQLTLNSSTDLAAIARQPAGGALATLFTLDNTGGLTLQAVDGSAGQVFVRGGGAGNPTALRGYSYRGTTAAPTPTLANDVLSQWSGLGCYSAGNNFTEQAIIRTIAIENWSGTGRGAQWTLYTTPAGTTSASSYMTLDGNGNLTISGPTGVKQTGTTWVNPSDPRLKQDVAPYAAGLAEIIELEPITYRLKAQPDGPLCYGFDAAKVRDVFPECVSETRMKLDPADEEDTDGVLTFDMHPILVALINAVKELAQKVP